MLKTQFSRLVTTAGIALVATFLSIVWPLVFYVLAGTAAVIGVFVLGAATYDWIIHDDTDLKALRDEQDRRHARRREEGLVG